MKRVREDRGDRKGPGRKRLVRKVPRRFTISMQKRLVFLFLLILIGFGVLGCRIILIQRDNGRNYSKQVLSQQGYDNKTLPYRRGTITDSKGTVLADSQLVYNVIIDSRQMLEKPEYLEPSLDAAEKLGVNREELINYMTAHPGSQYYIALKNLPYTRRREFDEEVKKGIEAEDKALEAAEAAAKEAKKRESEKKAGKTDESSTGSSVPEVSPVKLVYKNIKGIWFEDSYIRTYPEETLAADIIGFTTGGNKGAFGLEEYYDDTLNGIQGRTYGYVDESLNMEQTTIQPTDGNNLVLTIDANLQRICEKYLKEFDAEYKDRRHKGNGTNNSACIIMDVNTGGILAMASQPGFDLNNPYDISRVAGMPRLNEKDIPTSSYLSEEDAKELSDADRSRYLNALWSNYCISSHFEPGSTAKPFTTAMGMETGKLSTKDKFKCEGQYFIADTFIRCAHLEGCGELDIGGAIERSCNVSLIQEALKIGAEVFCKYQNIFNFGLKTNIDLAGEARTDDYLYALEDMSDINLATNSFGQNFEVTMIQMISGFCSLINGGNYYQPHIVDRITSSGGSTVQKFEPRVLKKTVSEDTSILLKKYLIQAVEGEHATGAQALPAGYRIGGKTGTAETLPRENEQYVVSFLGFAPADDPQIAIYVVLDRINKKKQDEAVRACTVARKILTEALPYLDIYMTEPLTEAERQELEALGLYDTNEVRPQDLDGAQQ